MLRIPTRASWAPSFCSGSCAERCRPGATWSPSLTVDVTQAMNGPYTYDYTLTVDASSTLAAGELDLVVSPFANLSAISGPSGWDVFYTPGSPGDTTITFSSPDSSTDIAPGSIGMFSMTSFDRPCPCERPRAWFRRQQRDLRPECGTILHRLRCRSLPALVLGVLALLGVGLPGRTWLGPSASLKLR